MCELEVKRNSLLVYIHETYLIIKSNPNVDEKISHSLLKYKDENKYIIDDGDLESNNKYEIPLNIKKLTITGQNNKVLLYRSACKHENLEINVKRFNILYLEGFDDEFPNMTIECTGKIKTYTENPFIVRNLIIKMDPDYVNESCIENFQVSENVNIHYMYNGSVFGNREIGCKYSKPENELCGKGILISIKKLTNEEQEVVDRYRNKIGYKTLTMNSKQIEEYRNINKLRRSQDSNKEKCMKCNKDIETMLMPCRHSVYCFDCVKRENIEYKSYLKSPYLKCPICSTYIDDIKLL